MNKKLLQIVGIIILAAIGLAVGYFFGFDHGWERAANMDFSRTGILLRNNEGLKPDTWYLSYDDGQIGQKIELILNSKSRCIYGDVSVPCVDSFSFSQGQRVQVEGHQTGEAVTVANITGLEGEDLGEGDQVPFQNSATLGFHGTLTLNGYVKVQKRICDPEGMCGETVDYASFVFYQAENQVIYDLLNEFAGNSFVSEGAVGLGCYQNDQKRIYSTNDADTGTVESVIIGSDFTKLMASNANNKVRLRMTKPIYTSGRGAPDCYSHFRNFDVL
jgi:hypothetical protein